MSDARNLEGTTRRGAIRELALALVAGYALPAAQAQHVHATATEEKLRDGRYEPKLFNEHEYRTIQRLAEMIIPKDGHSAGALEAGAPEYIDLLSSENDQLAQIFTGGIGWLDREMGRRFGRTFVEAADSEQHGILDQLLQRSAAAPKGEGFSFLRWVRRMTVDAFYTSRVGLEDLGYQGNRGAVVYEVPKEAIDYAMRRSPFA